jgi:LacI family transcriptional regulator
LVLNRRPCRISQGTKDKIFEIAEKLNYTPNMMAKGLVTQKTRTIGLVIPDIENAFFSSLSKSVEDYARSLGFMVMLMNNDDSHQMNMEVIQLLLDRNIDGLLIVSANESYQKEFQKDLRFLLSKMTIPFVMVDRFFDDFPANKVYFDNHLGGYYATKHLINHGHTNIACITGPSGTKSSDLRLEGYVKAMEEENYSIKPEWIVEGDYHFDSGYQKMKDLLTEDVSAIFGFNDLMAYGAMRTIHEANKTLPRDYSLVGYDHLTLSALIDSQLDSIEQNSKILGEEACKMLFKQVNKENQSIKEVCLKPVLIKKGSVVKYSQNH